MWRMRDGQPAFAATFPVPVPRWLDRDGMVGLVGRCVVVYRTPFPPPDAAT